MSNSFGKLFKITTFGESHGVAVGVVIDGCPPQIPITVADIQCELDRRRPGQSKITTPRKETDHVQILSGIFESLTTGMPITLIVNNHDANSKAYDHLKSVYRPSHADFTYQQKYGFRDYRGGGRSSARETIGRVAAGAIAQKILAIHGIEIVGFVSKIHTISGTIAPDITRKDVDKTIVRCPDIDTAEAMILRIEEARRSGDSVGGIVGCIARGVPSGLGEPVFDKLKADLAKAMLSIPATMGFEIGSGFSGTSLTGSEHNDPFYRAESGTVQTKTNRSGGIQGGISNGEPIYFNVAFKPTGTIATPQETVSTTHEPVTLSAKGRHDPCVLPRAVPIVESMTAIVLLDHLLRQRVVASTHSTDSTD
jgi:chorismate synthase